MDMEHGARAHPPQTHPVEVRQAYERVLAGSSISGRQIEVAGGQVHLLEHGAGSPLVLLHASGTAAGLFLPLLNELDGARAVAVDRPGHGLSDPVGLPRTRHREAVVAWVDHLLNTLELDTTALLGNSTGAAWALWYALARPERVERLVLVGPPAMPGTRLPLPLRLMATPGVGELVSRVAGPPTPESMLRFAKLIGEGDTLAGYPELVDLLVAVGRDPTADRVARAEVRAVSSRFALLSRSGWRRRSRAHPDELRRVIVPTLTIWGEQEWLGDASGARAFTELIPGARLEMLPDGHAPWLGQPARAAATIAGFLR